MTQLSSLQFSLLLFFFLCDHYNKNWLQERSKSTTINYKTVTKTSSGDQKTAMVDGISRTTAAVIKSPRLSSERKFTITFPTKKKNKISSGGPTTATIDKFIVFLVSVV